jgi:predicted Zn-dependent protease with MMP-like domain
MVKHRRGSRTAPRRPLRPTTRHRRFEYLIDEVLAAIPMPFAAALDDVAIVIDDEPSADQLRESELDQDETLYGLYEGVARTEYGADWIVAPNRITLFRLPLEADFPDPDELADEVRITVIHELAHHLGIDDERLHDLGVD